MRLTGDPLKPSQKIITCSDTVITQAYITQENIEEVMQTVEQLQQLFQELTIGGLRTLGQERLAVVDAMHEEFSRIGAHHIAEHLAALANGIRHDSRETAGILMRTQSAVRLLERILTLRVAELQLHELSAACSDASDPEDAPNAEDAPDAEDAP